MDEYYIYLRKSRADSPLESVEDVLARHETMLQELALKKLGYHIREDHILREVVSGETIIERPKMIELLRIIEANNVKAVLTIEPQRLTRGDLEDCGKVENAFRYSNTHIITLQMEYDLSNKMQRKFFEQELMRGNDYLEYTKEILRRGKILSAQKGNFMGQKAPFGYKKIKDSIGPTLEPDENAYIVQLIFDMYVNQGKGLNEIMRYLNSTCPNAREIQIWRRQSIQKLIKNPVYAGYSRYGYRKTVNVFEDGKVVKKRKLGTDYEANDVVFVVGRHRPLISKEMYEKADEKINNHPRNHYDLTIQNPFAGLIKCAKCGSRMRHHAYCGRANARLICTGSSKCHSGSVMQKDVAEKLRSILKDVKLPELEQELKNRNTTNKTFKNRQLKKAQDELCALEMQESKQYDLLEKGFYSEEVFIQRNQALHEEMEALRKTIDKLKVENEKDDDIEGKIVKLKAAIAALEDDTLSAQDTNIALKGIINRIYYEYVRHIKRGQTEYNLRIDLRI